jgi:hypothetical protein
MLALCHGHHSKADAGAFTTDQLRELKAAPPRPLTGRFDWLRHKILAVAGGSLYYETPILVQYDAEPVIWFERDPDGYALLSINMLSQSPEPRLALSRNDWVLLGKPSDFVSPPHGRSLRATYPNGDDLSLEFYDISDVEAFLQRFDHFNADQLKIIQFPTTAVTINMAVGGTRFRLGPKESTFGGIMMRGCVLAMCQVGVALGK